MRHHPVPQPAFQGYGTHPKTGKKKAVSLILRDRCSSYKFKIS